MNRDPRDDWASASVVPPQRSDDRHYRRLVNRVLIVGAFFICIAVLVAAVLGGMRLVEARSQSGTATSGPTATIRVDIPAGYGATQVGKLLQEKGVIKSSAAFVDLVKARGSEDKLKPGIYTLGTGQELIVIVEKLEEGSGLPSVKLTIPEGLAASQTAALLLKNGVMDSALYSELVEQPDKFTLPKLGTSRPRVKTLEGLLFPSTYYLLTGQGPEDLIDAQLEAFQTKTADLPWSKATALGVTPYEIVIIASLIEKEARIADERSQVAAVIYNRLKKKMALGIDATIRYAVDKWTGPLTDNDLKVDSPYNTRTVKGLPPTPIANPGLAALEAALEPADVDYLYYVLSDSDGHHFFTASYEEFLKAKEKAPAQ